MARDTIIAALSQERRTLRDRTKHEAFTVLIDLCRDGMSDAEILRTLDGAALRMPPDFVRELRAIATASGIKPDREQAIKTIHAPDGH